MIHGEPFSTYNPAETAIIYRMKDEFGPLSNFARRLPLLVNGLAAPTNEAAVPGLPFPAAARSA